MVYCAWCGKRLKVNEKHSRKMIDPKTLQPSKIEWGNKYYYFCNEEHKKKWLNSPIDECMICHKKLKTEAPINKYIQKDNLDWWICNICILNYGGA